MDYKLDLPQTRPSTENCLAWSEDGELAVAAGEHIVILGRRLFFFESEFHWELSESCTEDTRTSMHFMTNCNTVT